VDRNFILRQTYPVDDRLTALWAIASRPKAHATSLSTLTKEAVADGGLCCHRSAFGRQYGQLPPHWCRPGCSDVGCRTPPAKRENREIGATLASVLETEHKPRGEAVQDGSPL